MQKILPIVNVALAAIAMIVSIIVLLQVTGIKSSLRDPVEEEAAAAAAAEEEAIIPLSQLEEFNMTDSFILSFDSIENVGKKVNVVLKIGFAIDTENKGAEAARLVLAGQGQIIRDRIQKVLISKDVSSYQDQVKQDELYAEILVLVQTLIGNDAVTEVYFITPIISEK
jgi:flagellar basal body-associated protein FliL